MSAIHVFRADAQPLTRFTDPHLRKVIRNHPRAQFVCHWCRRRRWAKHLSVQVYYDTVRVLCTGGCVR